MNSNLASVTNGFAESLISLPDQRDHWRSYDTPLGIDEAIELVVRSAEADGPRVDHEAIDLRAWAFGSTDGETMALTRVPFRGRPRREPLRLRDHAFSQLCQRLGAPATYIRRLPAKLQVACMNYGLTRERRPALLRSSGDELRAILSDRYAPLDDTELFDVLGQELDGIGYRDEMRVRSLGTGSTTVLRITLPGEGVPIQKDDVIEYGIDVANSELGLRSVEITPVTYRLVCANGMRAWKSETAMRMRHVGDPARLAERLRDAIPLAFAEARGDLDRWRRSVDVMIDDALEEVASLRSFGLSSASLRDVERELSREANLLPAISNARSVSEALESARVSAFQVANAMTATAKGNASTIGRLSMEEAAHRYLARRAA